MRVYTLPKGEVIVQQEFELVYNDVIVHYVNNYAKKTHVAKPRDVWFWDSILFIRKDI